MPVFAPSPAVQTVGYLIDRTFDLLLQAAREEMSLLTSGIDDQQTTFSITYPPSSLNQGTYIAIDDEVMFIWQMTVSSGSGATLTVQRGMKGTPAETHNENSLVYINPYFTRYGVRRALQDDIRSWGPQVFGVKTVDIPLVNFIRGYDLGITGEWYYVLRAVESPDTLTDVPPDNNWREISYDVDHAADPSIFPSGNSITVTDPLGVFDTPRTLRVSYAAPIDVDSTFNDQDVLGVMGLESYEVDIPPYGAAWRLASGREVRRMLTEAQGLNVDLQQYPPGYQLKAAEEFKALRDSRLQDAVERLRGQYPIRRVA